MASRLLAALIGLLVATSAARAEIFEWTDAGGVRHFTNRKDLVPAGERADVRVVVPASEAGSAAPAAMAAASPADEATVAPAVAGGSRADWEDAYRNGLADGWAMRAGGAGQPAGGQVSIIGPLAVAHVEDSGELGGAPYAAWFPFEYPLVTTSFDRGRSRHLTIRMLLQDQFQLDRDGPFVFERLNPPGLGPNLPPFLPRGLPRHYARGSRVLFR